MFDAADKILSKMGEGQSSCQQWNTEALQMHEQMLAFKAPCANPDLCRHLWACPGMLG